MNSLLVRWYLLGDFLHDAEIIIMREATTDPPNSQFILYLKNAFKCLNEAKSYLYEAMIEKFPNEDPRELRNIINSIREEDPKHEKLRKLMDDPLKREQIQNMMLKTFEEFFEKLQNFAEQEGKEE